MPIIKIEDISHVRFSAPDLSEMRTFLQDFGLSCLEAGGKLYGRGRDGRPFLHATEPGEPAFKALGLRAESLSDLETLASHEGVPVEELDTPGGGKVVRLTDPDGFLVEVVAGQQLVEPCPAGPQALRNTSQDHPRLRKTVRLEKGPSNVQRLGHCVLGVTDFRASEAWYKARFGFLTSDEIEMAPGAAIGAFMRCDRGDDPDADAQARGNREAGRRHVLSG